MIQLTDDQLAIVSRVFDDNARNFFITGPAGTGKTALLAAIRAKFEQVYIRV